MFHLLHIDRTDRRLLDERKIYNILVGVNTLSHYDFHVVVRHNAYCVDTFNGNFPHEVSERIFNKYNNV